MHAHLRTGSDEQRTNVKSCSTFISWNPLLIQTNNLLHHFAEHFSWKFWHQNSTASALQTSCVLLHTKHTHLAIRASVSLKTLKSFLSIMQTGSSHVKFQILIGANFNLTPFTITIVASYIVIRLTIAKRQITPIDILHFA